MDWSVGIARIAEWSADYRRAWRKALDWWLTGLLAPMPSDWQRRLLARFGCVQLEHRTGEWFAAISGLSSQSTGVPVALSADDSFARARTALGLSLTTQCVLVLGSDAVLHRRLSLPSVAGAVLKNVVRNEIERLTPIPKDDLAFQYRIARHDRLQKRVLVDVFVARTSVVEGLVAHWVARGWRIGGATTRNGQDVEFDLDFLTEKQRAVTRPFTVRVPPWSVVAMAAAAVVALYAPSLRYSALRDAHAAELGELRTAAISARDALNRRDEAVSRDRFLVEQRAGRASVLASLNELTRILPDDTWLQQVHLREDEIQIQGVSASASAVVQLLEQSPLFSEAQFTAPISSTSGDSRERFVINVHVARRPTP